MATAIFSTAFLGPIEYYTQLLKHPDALIEINEHFPKQTYRNRLSIFGSNKKLTLSIPLQSRHRERTATKNIKISYNDNWQMILWRSITTAYRSAPFFEYYEAELEKLIFNKPEYLLEYNNLLHNWVCAKMKLNIKLTPTESYEKEYAGLVDFRTSIHPKTNEEFKHEEYMQVFSDKLGFMPNLSILDLLFNEGPQGTSILKQ
ncbi:MAG: WbqC family protein [Flavobacteriales bacterium]